MITCAYCGRPATMRIISVPDRVCTQHGLEFWTGLLNYSAGRPDVVLTEASQASPADHAGFALPMAS